MAQVQFGGSWYQTVGQAAKACAATMLPDTSVIESGEDVQKAATELEEFCFTEATRAGVETTPEGVEEYDWRSAVRVAIYERIKSR